MSKEWSTLWDFKLTHSQFMFYSLTNWAYLRGWFHMLFNSSLMHCGLWLLIEMGLYKLKYFCIFYLNVKIPWNAWDNWPFHISIPFLYFLFYHNFPFLSLYMIPNNGRWIILEHDSNSHNKRNFKENIILN